MTERQVVEIDSCPQCRGVWLDKDELDKLVAVMMVTVAQRPADEAHADGHH